MGECNEPIDLNPLIWNPSIWN